MDIDVLDMFRRLFGDDEMREAMIADPEATMREQGVEPPPQEEWQEAMERLRAELGAEYEATIAELESRMSEWEQARELLDLGEPPAYIGDLMVMGDGDSGWHCMVGGLRVPVMPEPETGGWELHHPNGQDIGYRPGTGEHYTRNSDGRMEVQPEPPRVDPWEGGHHEPPPSYGEYPVHGNPHDGYTVIIDGEEHQLRYDAERGWEYRAPDSGWVGHGDGGYYHHGPDGTRWVDDHHDAHHRPPHDEHGEPPEEPGHGEPGYGEPEYGPADEVPVDEHGGPVDAGHEPPHDGEPGYEPPHDEHGKPPEEPGYEEPDYAEPIDEHATGNGRPVREEEPDNGEPVPAYEEPAYADPPTNGGPTEEYVPAVEPEYTPPVEEHTPPVEEYTPPVEEYREITEMPVAEHVPPVEEPPAYDDALPPEPPGGDMAPVDDMTGDMMDDA